MTFSTLPQPPQLPKMSDSRQQVTKSDSMEMRRLHQIIGTRTEEIINQIPRKKSPNKKNKVAKKKKYKRIPLTLSVSLRIIKHKGQRLRY